MQTTSRFAPKVVGEQHAFVQKTHRLSWSVLDTSGQAWRPIQVYPHDSVPIRMHSYNSETLLRVKVIRRKLNDAGAGQV